jgi:hypothetical protein
MKKVQTQTYETYNHRILWQTAEKNLQLVAPLNKDAMFFALGAMFLFFAAFEGYLNWLGNRIAPETWKDEKRFFSRSPFQGTLGKYKYLAKILELPIPDKSQGPFKTAHGLLKLRNMVAHPKPEEGEKQVKVPEGDFPPLYQCELEKEVSPEAACLAEKHLKILADELHCKAKQTYSDIVHESSAFGSLLGMEITGNNAD